MTNLQHQSPNAEIKEVTKRRPRFEPRPYKALTLRAHHLELLQYVARYRMLQTHHFVILSGAHPSRIKERLRDLFSNGYLRRPKSQLYMWTTGSQPLVYTLSEKGAKVIGHHEPVPADNSKHDYLQHRIAVSEFRMMLDRAIPEHPDKLTLEPVCNSDQIWWEWRGNNRTGETRPVISFTHDGNDIKASVLPDGFFSIGRGDRQHPIFMEMDMGSMPVIRSTLTQTSIAKKLLVYWNLFDEHRLYKDTSLLSRSFNVSSFRVAFVTSSRERMERMILAVHNLFPKGRKLFLFTTLDKLDPTNPAQLFEPIWYTGETVLHNGRVVSPQEVLHLFPTAQQPSYLPQALL